MGMMNLYSVMPVVGSERIIFYRERGSAMYNPFAWGLAIAVVELPFLVLQVGWCMDGCCDWWSNLCVTDEEQRSHLSVKTAVNKQCIA